MSSSGDPESPAEAEFTGIPAARADRAASSPWARGRRHRARPLALGRAFELSLSPGGSM